MANYIYGIDIGGTTVKMGLFDEEGTMIDKWEIRDTQRRWRRADFAGYCGIDQRKE